MPLHTFRMGESCFHRKFTYFWQIASIIIPYYLYGSPFHKKYFNSLTDKSPEEIFFDAFELESYQRDRSILYSYK